MFATFVHNMEVAHRLSETFPGSKCENIHGHSMKVEMTLHADYDNGVMVDRDGTALEFGQIKKTFRTYIDENYDHRLLLNKADPWANPIFMFADARDSISDDVFLIGQTDQKFLPGLVPCDGDPTTENLCAWIAEHFANLFKVHFVEIKIQETGTNAVGCAATDFGGEVGIRVI